MGLLAMILFMCLVQPVLSKSRPSCLMQTNLKRGTTLSAVDEDLKDTSSIVEGDNIASEEGQGNWSNDIDEQDDGAGGGEDPYGTIEEDDDEGSEALPTAKELARLEDDHYQLTHNPLVDNADLDSPLVDNESVAASLLGLPCASQIGLQVGSWIPLGSTKYVATTVKRGTEVVDRVITTSDFEKVSRRSMKASITGKVKPFKAGKGTLAESLAVSSAITKLWRVSYARDFTKRTWSEKIINSWASKGIPQDRTVWRWRVDSYNACREKMAETFPMELIHTQNYWREPCCQPEGWNNFPKDEKSCKRGFGMFSRGKVPSHCGTPGATSVVTVANTNNLCSGVFRQSGDKYVGANNMILWWRHPWWICSKQRGLWYGLFYSQSKSFPIKQRYLLYSRCRVRGQWQYRSVSLRKVTVGR